jgi:hypothetical protein
MMALSGRKPNDRSVNKTPSKIDWIEVENLPYSGPKPELPLSRTFINPKGEVQEIPIENRTRFWWEAITSMPHCILWQPSDWQFCLDTAMVHASASHGSVTAMSELRQREKIMGTTVEARRDLRIRYLDPQVLEAVPAPVTQIDDRRSRLLDA